jgi:hypothetical protein
MPSDPPGPTRAELAREVLLHRMRTYSEEFHCAGWLGGLEFLLWNDVEEDGLDSWIQDRKQLGAECRTLAEIAGGWWVYRDETRPADRGPVFISMERWREILARRDSQKSP